MFGWKQLYTRKQWKHARRNRGQNHILFQLLNANDANPVCANDISMQNRDMGMISIAQKRENIDASSEEQKQ